jgi:hypothetical protein
VVLGGFLRVRQFSFVGGRFGALSSWFLVIFGKIGNFPLWGVNLGHYVYRVLEIDA